MAKLPAHQQAIVDEQTAIDSKLQDITTFIGSSDFTELDEEDQSLLRYQAEAMRHYTDILSRRISRF